jgi:hypothetical protein
MLICIRYDSLFKEFEKEKEVMFWGYVHTENNKIHIKRYFDERDLEDAYESAFCMEVRGPVEAVNQSEALVKLYPEYVE